MNLAAAFASAQRSIALATGMPATAEGNTLIDGHTYIGVFGEPRVDESANPGGGRRRLAQVSVRLTRAQFDAPPPSNTQLTRTDVTPQIVYRVDSVDSHDPFFYVLELTKVGA